MNEEKIMNDNPIVIFLDTKKAKDCGLNINQTLPCGWDEDGNLLPLDVNKSYTILLLEDCCDVPTDLEYKFMNINKDAPLFVVGHTGTTLHENPEQDPSLKKLGKPKLLEKFHHRKKEDLAHDPKYSRIVNLIERQIEAPVYVDLVLKKNIQHIYTNLAAIAQIGLLGISSTDKIKIQLAYETNLFYLPNEIKNELKTLIGSNKFKGDSTEAEKLLKYIINKNSNTCN